MINVDLLSVIRRWYYRDRLSIREIERRSGLSRNTVRKYLRGGQTQPQYPSRQNRSVLDPYTETLEQWLAEDRRRHRKRRRTAKQLYREIKQLGYPGSYDRVAAFVRQYKQHQRELAGAAGKQAYVPLIFPAGDAFQFDWSEDWLPINGKSTKVQVAHIKLCHSRAFIMRVYLQQSHEMLFDAHQHAFRVLGGVPARGIYDNMKTAIDQIGRGKQRQVNARFRAMVSHYCFEPVFCNPAAGWEKGQVEKQVRDMRYRLLQEMPELPDLATVNDYLESRCVAVWDEMAHPEQTDKSIAAVLADEQSQLMPVPRPFDGFIEHSKRVSPTCLILFERNRYSVPAALANQAVSLKVYADTLVITAHGQEQVRHPRVFSRDHRSPGQTVYDWCHYLGVIQRKPGALRNGAPFTELPPILGRLQRDLLKREGGDREMADILALVLQYDESLLLTAVQNAFDAGVVSKTHIVNQLSRLLDPPKPARLSPPSSLSLNEQPKANTARYDRLREVAND